MKRIGFGQLALLILALTMALPARAETETLWADYPGLKGPGHAGIEVGDFDGNGKSEAVVTTYTWGSSGTNGLQLLATLASTGGEPLKISAVSIIPSGLIGPMARAPQDGLADRLLAVATSNGANNKIVTLGGDPLQVLRTVEAPLVRKVTAVADVDADGQLDIVAMASTTPSGILTAAVLDYATGAVKWVGSEQITDIGVAQLDSDPALELITAGWPLRVMDGLTHAIEWSDPGGEYAEQVLVGQFEAGSPTMGFAMVGYEFVQVFRTQPYALTTEFWVNGQATGKVVRRGGAGTDEIAIGAWSEVSIHNPGTGQKTFSSVHQARIISDLAFGDIDDDGTSEVVFAGGLQDGGMDTLRVVDVESQAIDFHETDEAGPYSGVVVGDFSGNGTLEAAYIVVYSDSSYSGPRLRVLDHATGRRLREQRDFGNPPLDVGFAIASAQLDADPQMELLFSGADFGDGVLIVVDGASLELEWRVGGYGSVIEGAYISEPSIIDVTGDGIPEIVFTARKNSLVRVVVLDGRDGTLIWNSVGVTASHPRLAILQTDSGDIRAAMTTGYAINVFDLKSHLLVSSMVAARPVFDVAAWEGASGCRFATLDNVDVLTIHYCDDLAIERQVQMPVGTALFRPIDAQANQFLAAAGSQLFEVDSTGDAVVLGGGWGDSLAAANRGVVTLEPDGQHVDVVLGSDFQVMRSRIGLNNLFANGFD